MITLLVLYCWRAYCVVETRFFCSVLIDVRQKKLKWYIAENVRLRKNVCCLLVGFFCLCVGVLLLLLLFWRGGGTIFFFQKKNTILFSKDKLYVFKQWRYFNLRGKKIFHCLSFFFCLTFSLCVAFSSDPVVIFTHTLYIQHSHAHFANVSAQSYDIPAPPPPPHTHTASPNLPAEYTTQLIQGTHS